MTVGKNAGDFLRLLGNGREFGLRRIHYTYQEEEGGIADALSLAEHFADGDKICVALGDNSIEYNIYGAVESFNRPPRGAKVILKNRFQTHSASEFPRFAIRKSFASRRTPNSLSRIMR